MFQQVIVGRPPDRRLTESILLISASAIVER